jgi:hypothetical protein
MRSGILFTNADMSGDLVSRAFPFTNLERLSIHATMSGVPDGSLLIQCSNDPVDYGDDVVNWVDYTDSLAPILGIEQVMYNIRDLSFRWLRLAYVQSSGTGLLSATFQTVKRF